MHSVIWKFIRYVLWTALILILGLVCIGLSKFDWNVKLYVNFLNERSRSEAREQGGITNVFWGTWIVQQDEKDEQDENVELETWDSSLDVYDPSFEDDLNDIPQDDVVIDEETPEDFGFVGSDETTESGDSRDQLLELIKERETQ